jgi:hypothetical protein
MYLRLLDGLRLLGLGKFGNYGRLHSSLLLGGLLSGRSLSKSWDKSRHL